MFLKKLIKFFLCFTILILFETKINAQEKIPAPILGAVEVEDSITLAKKKTQKLVVKSKPKLKRVTDSFPDPQKAWKWAIIPGGGQIYNNKALWIRLPIVYGGLAFGIQRIVENSKNYSNLKLNDYNIRNKLPLDTSLFPYIGSASADQIRQARDAYFNSLELSYIFTGIGYLLSGLEAFTTAHLAHFDVKDDLKVSFKPAIISTPLSATGSVTGIAFVVNF